jgi:hypothetical protein
LAEEIRARRSAVAASLEQPPHDWTQRQREMEAWCKKVGWRM